MHSMKSQEYNIQSKGIRALGGAQQTSDNSKLNKDLEPVMHAYGYQDQTYTHARLLRERSKYKAIAQGCIHLHGQKKHDAYSINTLVTLCLVPQWV